MSRKTFITIIITATILKLALFTVANINAPKAKIQLDTKSYLESGITLATKGVFGTISENGSIAYQYLRTPGYPLFLGIFHGLLNIPLNGIILLQILLNIVSAIIFYKTVLKIHPASAKLTLIILLFEPSITIYSLMLLTEALYIFILSLFTYCFVNFLQKNTFKNFALSTILITLCVFIRPITLYITIPLSIFLFFKFSSKSIKQAIIYALSLLIVFYSSVGFWQWRNYKHFGDFKFSNIDTITINDSSLYHTYHRKQDSDTQNLPPTAYYLNAISRCLLSLFTRPASLKNFNSHTLTMIGKIICYPWIIFWMSGFLVGLFKLPRNKYYLFFLIMIGYFTVASIGATGWGVNPRFRSVMMPFIAIISAYGWSHKKSHKKIGKININSLYSHKDKKTLSLKRKGKLRVT